MTYLSPLFHDAVPLGGSKTLPGLLCSLPSPVEGIKPFILNTKLCTAGRVHRFVLNSVSYEVSHKFYIRCFSLLKATQCDRLTKEKGKIVDISSM